MVEFLDGAIVSAVSLFVALVLSIYADAHPEWFIFENEATAVTIAVTLTATLVVGCVAAISACAENGLALLPWTALFVAVQAAAVAAYRIVKRVVAPRIAPAT